MSSISLFAWSKAHGIVYSQAQKMVATGSIQATRVGNRVMVDDSVIPPETHKVKCAICGASVSQITSSHLRYHNYDVGRYKAEFPDAPIVSTAVSSKISQAITGTVRSEKTKARISASRKGVIPKDHPRHVKGVHTVSEGTRRKMSVAHAGRRHSDETKKKIGDGNRGKVMPREVVERLAQLARDEYASGKRVSSTFGTARNTEVREKISEKMRSYWNSIDAERRAIMSERKSRSMKGIKRTDEQKARYSESRLKSMEENPDTYKKMRDTSLERDFEYWCIAGDLACKKQCFISFEGKRHPYDFFIPEYNMLIECDGPIHWADPYFEPSDGISKGEYFEKQKEKDEFWTRAAIELGFYIVRLRGIKKVGDEGSGTIEEQIAEWLNQQCPKQP